MEKFMKYNFYLFIYTLLYRNFFIAEAKAKRKVRYQK